MSDLSDIADILASRDLGRFLGRSESAFFDAKSGQGPYDLITRTGQFELAKDVSSFANSGGGFIIVGLKTVPAPSADTETVSSLDLIAKTDFNVGKYEGLLREYVFPAIAGLSVEWIESSKQATLGVGAISVPEQSSGSKPFLISQLDDKKGKKREIVFGIATRNGANSDPHSKETLRAALLKGTDEPSVRLTAIEKQLSVALEQLDAIRESARAMPAIAAPAISPGPDELDARIRHALETK